MSAPSLPPFLVLELSAFIPYVILTGVNVLTYLRNRKTMADLTAFNAALEANTAATNEVAQYVPTLSDANVQAAIDAGTQALTTNTATLKGLVPAPASAEPAQ